MLPLINNITQPFMDIDLLDFLLTLIVTILMTLFTYLVIYSLKPKLKIEKPEFIRDTIRVRVINKGRFAAVNIRIEICAYDEVRRLSYHFITDHKDFLIIPSRRKVKENEKIFKTIGFEPTPDAMHETYANLISKIREKKLGLRVRLHSYHSFSGLGKAEEAIFYL